jgi:hypothetical protein
MHVSRSGTLSTSKKLGLSNSCDPRMRRRRIKYISVAYNGMGFFACRKGVIEKLKYPYFSYPLIEIEAEDGKILRDMCSEDVAFCKNLTDAGFDIMVNTDLVVGHEKTLVI